MPLDGLNTETVTIVLNAVTVAAQIAIFGIPVRVFVKYGRQWMRLRS